jgi:hypothetical protein
VADEASDVWAQEAEILRQQEEQARRQFEATFGPRIAAALPRAKEAFDLRPEVEKRLLTLPETQWGTTEGLQAYKALANTRPKELTEGAAGVWLRVWVKVATVLDATDRTSIEHADRARLAAMLATDLVANELVLEADLEQRFIANMQSLNLTPDEQETIHAVWRWGTQQKAAAKLGVSASRVNQRLTAAVERNGLETVTQLLLAVPRPDDALDYSRPPLLPGGGGRELP